MYAITKRWYALAAAVSLMATLGAGCSGSSKPAPKGDVRIAVSGMQNLQTDVISMTLTVGQGTPSATNPQFNPGGSTIVVPMSKNNNGEWNGFVQGIPVGDARTFHVDAKDATNAVVYAGNAVAAITQGGTALVYMMLQQVAPPNNFNNHAPVIDSITSSAGIVAPGGTVSLTVAAHDPDTATDSNNKISGYLWQASCGTLANPTTTTPTWTAPAGPDTSCTITVTVSDVCPSSQPAICSSSVTASLVVKVQTPQTGSAQVNAYPNTCPVISCVYADQKFSYDANGKVNGYEADLTINATDAEGDDLHYVWKSTGCPGAIFTPTGANPTAEITNTPTKVHLKANTVAACDVRVDVLDYWPGNTPPVGSNLPPARGCDNAGFLYLGGAKDFGLAPVIVNLIQPNAQNQVQPGQKYTFGANVSDPQNAYPLRIDWYNDSASGTFGAQVPGSPFQLAAAGQATMEWTAPNPLASGMKIRLRVTNALNPAQFTEHVFSIVPANACALAANGTACDDGNACTQTDTCQNGVCVGSNPVTCTAANACTTSTCNPANGQCVAGNQPANTPCSDGSVCTTNDLCNGSGVCTGTAVPAPAAPLCQVVSATCDPVNGWTFANAVAGTACNDGNACTQGDACNGSGACLGTAVPPPTAPACKVVSTTCDPVNGWTLGNAANGTACSDGFACTQTDTCQAGVCVGSNPVACSAPNVCSEPAGTCAPPGPPSASVLTQQGGALGLALGLAVDEQGFVYEGGNMFQPGYDFGSGLINSSGSQDAFVVKLDPSTGRNSPTVGWSKDYGDATNDQGVQGLGVNLTQVGIAGRFAGLMDIGGGHSLNNAGSAVDYVAGLDRSSGAGLWIKAFDLNDPAGTPTGQLNGITGGLVSTDPSSGHFAVCGYVSGKVPNTASGISSALVTDGAAVAGGGLDIVVAVLDSAGAVVWGKQFGGAGDQTCSAVAFDDGGNVLITGQHKGTLTGTGGLPAPASGLTNPTGSNSWAFVLKLNGLTGAPIAYNTFGSAGTTRATPRAIAVDASGNVVITGQFQGSVAFGATTLTATGTTLDVFVAKLGSSLAPTWAQRLGGTAADDARGISVDSVGQVWVTGIFDGTATNTWGGASLVSSGGNDAFILRLDPATGNASYAAAFGDTLGQEGFSIAAGRFASGGQKDQVWSLGAFTGTITFPGQPVLTGSTTETRKYLVKMK